jgi:hypothetical protein
MITHGLPVNTVVNTTDLRTLLQKASGKIAGSILLAPVLPDKFGLTKLLLKHARSGGRVLFYGPLEHSPELCRQLQIKLRDPLDGDFKFSGKTAASRKIRHLSFLSAGAWREVSTGKNNLAEFNASQKSMVRSAGLVKKMTGGGKIGWVRGSLATAEFDPAHPAPIKGPRLKDLDSAIFLPSEQLARNILGHLGMKIDWREKAPSETSPMLTIHRHRNGFVFSIYQPDVSVQLRLGFELGAPLFTTMKNLVEKATTIYSGPSSGHYVCRTFVKNSGTSAVNCRILPPVQHGYTLRLLVSGIKNATVHFFPEPGTEKQLEILREPMFPYFIGDFVKPVFDETVWGRMVTVTHVTGEVLFSW